MNTFIAIIGIGSMYPQADDASKFWTNIKNRVDAITEVPESHWKAEDYFDPDPKAADKVYAKLGGFLSPVEFNPMEFGILPNAIEAIDGYFSIDYKAVFSHERPDITKEDGKILKTDACPAGVIFTKKGHYVL